MKQHDKNGIRFFQFDSFPEGVIDHGVLGRLGGVSPEPFKSLNMSRSVPDAPENYQENQRRGYEVFGRTKETLVHAHLVHKSAVSPVTSSHNSMVILGTDALITNDIGCGLTMNYADCAPIFVYDPENHAIGLGHAGWQGAVMDVPGAMVRAMGMKYGSRPEKLLGGIGPCIGSCCYEVDEPLVSRAQKAFPKHINELLLKQPNKTRFHFDLEQANYINFINAGVTKIERSGFCTGCNTDLFFPIELKMERRGVLEP